MNTKFSSAIHTLILISEAKEALSSEEIAESVGSNSSYIRKVLGLLKKSGIINSRQGITGFELNKSPNNITLKEVYQALENKPFFDIHQNPSDKCIVGRHIQSTLGSLLEEIEVTIDEKLSSKTLADCIKEMKEELTEEELKQL